jgi:hypothetical protein
MTLKGSTLAHVVISRHSLEEMRDLAERGRKPAAYMFAAGSRKEVYRQLPKGVRPPVRLVDPKHQVQRRDAQAQHKKKHQPKKKGRGSIFQLLGIRPGKWRVEPHAAAE